MLALDVDEAAGEEINSSLRSGGIKVESLPSGKWIISRDLSQDLSPG
jgi:hypothetical protein